MDWVAASPLLEFEWSDGTTRIHLRKAAAGVGAQAVAPSPSPAAAASGEQAVSPLYGIFHVGPAPGAPPYVSLGQQVRAGETLCVIEAMKMFHKVEAACDGTIDAILAVAGDEVAVGQPLFSIGQAGQ
ncbi:acetyl-CoA carboxylase biotin carboxyl carrier protein [Devosia sp. A369]